MNLNVYPVTRERIVESVADPPIRYRRISTPSPPIRIISKLLRNQRVVCLRVMKRGEEEKGCRVEEQWTQKGGKMVASKIDRTLRELDSKLTFETLRRCVYIYGDN